MIVENLHRADLTRAETAKAYEQLALLGLSDTRAARATGQRRGWVKMARTIAADPIAIQALGCRAELTFDQALVIADVAEGDEQVADELVRVAADAPGRFDHVVAGIRQQREDQRCRDERVAELTAAGIAIVDEHELPTRADRLHQLTATPGGEDFVPLEADEHAACPGHAASLAPWDPRLTTYWCLDPDTHGHRRRWARQAPPTPEEEEARRVAASAERREVIANNKAWRAAEPVRRAHVSKLLDARRVPAGTMRYLVDALMRSPEALGRCGTDGLLTELTGTEAPGPGWGRHVGPVLAAHATDARLPLVLLAQHAADLEGEMGVHTWRHDSTRAAAWLRYLATTGYTLADVEQLVIDNARGGADETQDAGVVDITDRTEPSNDESAGHTGHESAA
jgi:ParB family chromosome partitioning protein